MFDYQKKFNRPKLVSLGRCRPCVFRPQVDGSNALSFDYSVEESNPLDFSLDRLISANVPLESSPVVEDLSLNALDTIDNNVSKVFESEKYIIKDDNNNN